MGSDIAADHSSYALLDRTAALVRAGLAAAFRQTGSEITPEQWIVLTCLRDAEGAHQSSLAGLAGRDRHNMTRILAIIEERGLVTRVFDEKDLRRLNVHLTERGRAVQEQLAGVAGDYMSRATDGLRARDLAAMQRILSLVAHNLSDVRDMT